MNRRRLTRLALACWLMALSLCLPACANGLLAGLGRQSVLLQEEFGPGVDNQWLLEGDEAGRVALDGDRLLIQVDAPEIVQFTTLQNKVFTDFTLEVDATRLAGPARSSYGVLFRLQDGQSFYHFTVLGDGHFQVELHQPGGETNSLTNGWQETTALRSGVNETNRLKIVALGATLSFYANDMALISLADSSIAQGAIGLSAGTFGEAGVQVSFDNLVVR